MIILKLTAENNCVSGIHSHLHHSSAAHHCPSRIADRFLTYSMNLSDWAFAQQVGTISHKITVSTHVYICMSWLCLIMMFYHSLIILSYLILSFLLMGPSAHVPLARNHRDVRVCKVPNDPWFKLNWVPPLRRTLFFCSFISLVESDYLPCGGWYGTQLSFFL